MLKHNISSADRPRPPSLSGSQWLLSNCYTNLTGHRKLVPQPYLRHDTASIAKIRARLRFRRARVNHHLHPFNLIHHDHCDDCMELFQASVQDSVDHLLLDCPVFDRGRYELQCYLSSLPGSVDLAYDRSNFVSAVLGILPASSKRFNVKAFFSTTAKFLSLLCSHRKSL